VVSAGPYLNVLGFSWLGKQEIQQYQIWRQEDRDHFRMIADLPDTTVTYQDDSAKPNTSYKYKIVAIEHNQPVKEVTLAVRTPGRLPSKALDALNGKGIILYIDPSDPSSSFYYKK